MDFVSDIQNQLNTSLHQTVQLSQKMMESIQILQMDGTEIRELVQKEAQENPLLETDQEEVSQAKLEFWTEYRFMHSSGKNRSASANEDIFAKIPDQDVSGTLEAHLLDQLGNIPLSEDLQMLCRYLIHLCDEDGRFTEDDLLNLASSPNIGDDKLEKGLSIIRSLDPAGVGAIDLQQCLLLQLSRIPGEHTLLAGIIREDLPKIAKKQYASLAKKYGVSQGEVRKAAETIQSFTPHPGAGFTDKSKTAYIIPDVLVSEEDGTLHIHMNRDSFPVLGLNSYYCNLDAESLTPVEQDFIRKKKQQAQWLMETLTKRESTVSQCVRIIAECQSTFFLGMSSALQPLSLADMAEKTGLHKATISRALSGKYLVCRQGCYPLNHFLVRQMAGSDASNHQLLQSLRELIRNEDVLHPYSDQALSDILTQKGICVSRRMIAKYRLTLGIPNSSARNAR